MSWMTRIGIDRHALVERHFAGSLAPRLHRRMWQHLESCDSCRQRYRAHVLLEALEPDAEAHARVRLAPATVRTTNDAGTSWRSAARGNAKRTRAVWLGLGAAIAGAAGMFVAVIRPDEAATEFAARGAPVVDAAAPSVTVYRVPSSEAGDGVPQAHARAYDHVVTGEGLAFSYHLPSGTDYPHLMLFAVDAVGHVFWYWPAWQDGQEDPRSVTITASPRSVELGEAIFHEYQPGPLQLYGLFSNHPQFAKAVEAIIAEGGPQALQGAGNHLWSQSLEVRP